MAEKRVKGGKKRKRRFRKGTSGATDSSKPNPFSSANFFAYEKHELKIFAYCLGIIFLLTFAAHTITIWGKFVYLDLFNLSEIRYTRDWGRFFSDLMLYSLVNPLNEPLVKLSLTVDVLSMGIRSPGIFHAINMLLHLANSVLLFLLVRRLANYHSKRESSASFPDIIALASAALFACHPLACGAISYISARAALLVVLNYFAALHLFLTGFLSKEIKDALYYYGLSYLFVIFAIWSGPQAITIPGAFILLALLIKPKDQNYKAWVMDRPFEFFAQLLVAVSVPLVLLLNFNPLVGNGFGLTTLALPEYVATQFKVLATYTLRCFLVPYGLSLDPPMSLSDSFSDPFTITGIIIVVLASFLAFKLKENLVLSFSLCLFVLSLFPSCFVPQPEYVSITRIYLTMASLCMISGYLIGILASKKPTLAIVLSSIILVAFIGLANFRNYQWHDDVRLWKSAKQMNPTSKRSISMYAWAVEFHDDIDEGYRLAKKAYETDKDNVILNLILGNFHLSDQDFKLAYKFYKNGARLAEKKALSREIQYQLQKGLAESALMVEDYDTALTYAKKANQIQKSAKLYYIEGVCLLAQDNPHGAYMKLQESYLMDKLNPDLIEPLTRAALGCGTEQLQDMAYQMSKQAYKVHGTTPRIVLLRAYAALETGRVNEALKHIKTFHGTEKPTAESLYLLYGCYKRLGLDKKADSYLRLALEQDPKIRQNLRLYLNRELVKKKGAKGSSKQSKQKTKSQKKPSTKQKKIPKESKTKE